MRSQPHILGSNPIAAVLLAAALALPNVALATQAARISTDKTDYVPGEIVVMTGSNWQPGETVTLLLHETPTVYGDTTLTAVAGDNGNFVNADFYPKPHHVGVMFTLTATGLSSGWVAQTTFHDAGVNMDQGANGKLTGSFVADPLGVSWQNGDLNGNNSHFHEGLSVPYRVVLTGLATGAHTLTIEWDIRQGGKNCLDYITNVALLDPHNQFIPVHSAEIVNPLRGLSGSFSGPLNFTIPTPAGSPQPSTSFGALPAGKNQMSIWNGSITGLSYVSQGSLIDAASSTSMQINFNATTSTVVLAWGGHIASELDWGAGNSASTESGSPYHMRILDLDGSGGNQDRGLKTDAVLACDMTGPDAVCAGVTNSFTATSNQSGVTFTWSFVGANTAGASFVGSTTSSTVQVTTTNAGTYTLHVAVSVAGAGTFCEKTVTVNAAPVCSITGPSPVCPSTSGNTYNGPPGMDSYAWSLSGSGTISSLSNGPSVTVNSTSVCSGSFTLTLTVTQNGCSSTCTKTVTVEDKAAPTITGVGGPSTIECPATPTFSQPSASDACDPSPTLTFADVTTPGSCAQSYSVTRTWTATDKCSNKSTASQTITVQDKTAPTISGVGGPSTIDCPATPVFSQPTASDVCDPSPTFTFADVTTPGSCPQNFSVTRTWTATDHCGNSSTASQTITVQDKTAPTISGVGGPSTIDCPATPVFSQPTASDVCDPSPTFTFADVTTPGSCPQNFSVTRTWTATDHCGNSSTASQTITVQDKTAPTISGVGGPKTIECSATLVFSQPTASDLCDPSPTFTFADVTTPGSCPQSYSVTRTWTATDHCGNSSTASQTITVQDKTAPTITGVGGPQTIECPATPVFSQPTASDLCDPSPTFTFADVTAPGSCAQSYSVTRTWTATDHCGNSSTASQTITVQDKTAPTITGVGGPQTIECPATPVFSEPTASDLCDPKPTFTFADVTAPGSCAQSYSVTRTWTATDHCGNSSTASQTITVQDKTAPTIAGVGGPSTIECPATPVFSEPTASDLCDPKPTFTFADVTTPGSCAQSYGVTRTWTATDHCGNSSTASQTITVQDKTAPTISGVGGPQTIECPATPVFSEPTASDLCDPKPTLTHTDITTPGTCPQSYKVKRTWTATDHCGNSVQASQTITVQDKTAPTISGVGGPSTIECPATPVFSDPTASDLCDPKPTLTFADVTTPGSCAQSYSVTRTWTATDHCGNSSTASQTITVQDKTAPTIAGVGGPSTIECPATPVFSDPTASDLCDPKPTLTFADVTSPGSCAQSYSVTRTWTATDHCGNSSTASQTITVQDKTAPTITGVGGPQTIECPATPVFSEPTASDLCDPKPTFTFADVTAPGSCPQSYSVTRTWTATDHCGNSSTASQTITVQDKTAPTIAGVGGPSTIECPATPVFSDPTASDLCDPKPTLTFADVTSPGSCPQNYSVTRTWTATDHCGNSSTASQTITVQDKTAPEITGVGGPQTIECPATPKFSSPTATDLCDPAPTLTYEDVKTLGGGGAVRFNDYGTPCPQGYTLTRTWTATDHCGNVSTASQVGSSRVDLQACKLEYSIVSPK